MNRSELMQGMGAAATEGREAAARIRRDLAARSLTASRLEPRLDTLLVNLAIIEQGLKLLEGPEFAHEPRVERILVGGRS